jgi:hypothetical protein
LKFLEEIFEMEVIMIIDEIFVRILEEIFVRISVEILEEILVELFIFILNIIDKLFLNELIDR